MGAMADHDQVELKKEAKYTELGTIHCLVPLVVETTGVFRSEAHVCILLRA